MSTICCIGHLTNDRIITPSHVAEMTGGVAYYLSCAITKLYATNYILVTKTAFSDRKIAEKLRQKGIDVRWKESKETVFFENIYGENIDERRQRVLATAEPFTLSDIEGLEADFFHLGTLLPDDFPIEVFESLHRRGRISADAQGFLRKVMGTRVKACPWDDKERFLQYIDIIKVNEEELFALTNTHNIRHGCQQIAALGPKEVVTTLGSLGSIILHDGEFISIPAYPPIHVVDTTGCGDTYMAGYLYCRAKNFSVEQSGHFAAAMCTLKMAHRGPFSGTIDDIKKIVGEEHINKNLYTT